MYTPKITLAKLSEVAQKNTTNTKKITKAQQKKTYKMTKKAIRQLSKMKPIKW